MMGADHHHHPGDKRIIKEPQGANIIFFIEMNNIANGIQGSEQGNQGDRENKKRGQFVYVEAERKKWQGRTHAAGKGGIEHQNQKGRNQTRNRSCNGKGIPTEICRRIVLSKNQRTCSAAGKQQQRCEKTEL
ncbi:MAG: hypothetical protein NTY86_04065 [Deltaproteobacteria bacterium]|nr:hypothetical protein [Deltaproteobacteria bacterium]